VWPLLTSLLCYPTLVSCVAIVLDERTIRLDEEVKAKAETRGLKVEIRNGGGC